MAQAKSRKTRGQPVIPKRKAKWRTWAGFRYDTTSNGMAPFFMGLAAAEFLPSDPALWFQAAIDAGLPFAPHEGDVLWDTNRVPRRDKARCDFILGWLIGTPGGREAIHDWLQQRGIIRGIW
jgi:hypothetical protein